MSGLPLVRISKDQTETALAKRSARRRELRVALTVAAVPLSGGAALVAFASGARESLAPLLAFLGIGISAVAVVFIAAFVYRYLRPAPEMDSYE
jgi:TctA family transporter